MALSKKNRIKKKNDFDKVFKKNRAIRGDFLFAKFRINDLGYPRFGFIVSSKIFKKAVDRNKFKRLMSEVAAKTLKTLNPFDVVVIADKKAALAPKKDIQDDLSVILKRIK